jgi:hypothetical protein
MFSSVTLFQIRKYRIPIHFCYWIFIQALKLTLKFLIEGQLLVFSNYLVHIL